MCNAKQVACDETTENHHEVCDSPQLCAAVYLNVCRTAQSQDVLVSHWAADSRQTELD